MGLLWLLILAIVVAALFFLRRRRPAGRSAQLRARILKRVRDPAVLDSLLRAERERHPRLPEAALLRRVLGRLDHDARR